MILYSMNLNPRIKCLNLYLLIILIYLKLNSFNILNTYFIISNISLSINIFLFNLANFFPKDS